MNVSSIASMHPYSHYTSAFLVLAVATCFSGDSQVQLLDGNWKAIGELQPGDLLSAYDGSKLVSTEFIMTIDRHSSMNSKSTNRIYSLISDSF